MTACVMRLDLETPLLCFEMGCCLNDANVSNLKP